MLASLFSCGITRLQCWYSSDADAGAVHPIAPVDPGGRGGKSPGGAGMGGRPPAAPPRPRRIRQLDHDRARVFVVSEYEHVAIDVSTGFELGCADIVERGLHA